MNPKKGFGDAREGGLTCIEHGGHGQRQDHWKTEGSFLEVLGVWEEKSRSVPSRHGQIDMVQGGESIVRSALTKSTRGGDHFAQVE
jgi:hypothetical protein